MGTQQLLLIVLGVIIVGIAVVVGVNIFGTNADQANKDAITQDCLRLAASAQGYYRKPSMLGGGGSSFDGATLADLGMSDGTNINGTYVVTPADQTCEIEGTSSTVAGATVTINVAPGSIDDPVFAGWD